RDDPQYEQYFQYDNLIYEDVAFGGSLNIHWNFGIPTEGIVYEELTSITFEGQNPRVDRIFLGDGTDLAVTSGWVAYPIVGVDEGDLSAICFSLALEGGHTVA